MGTRRQIKGSLKQFYKSLGKGACHVTLEDLQEHLPLAVALASGFPGSLDTDGFQGDTSEAASADSECSGDAWAADSSSRAPLRRSLQGKSSNCTRGWYLASKCATDSRLGRNEKTDDSPWQLYGFGLCGIQSSELVFRKDCVMSPP